jgi:hypothetical protein
MADRWFDLLSKDVFNALWCQSTYLCKSMLPSYFLLIFVCMAGLLIIMYFQCREPFVVVENSIVILDNLPVSQKQARVGLWYIIGSIIGFAVVVIICLINQHFPGWNLVYVWFAFLLGCFLLTIPLESVKDFWRRNGELWVSILLAHISIVAILVGYFSQPQLFWATLVILILAMANLWRFRQQVPLIFWVISLAMIVYTININGWWTAAVGDEYDFHILAWKLAEKISYRELGDVLFQANGANGTHPYFSSFLQAISMKFFGHDNFGWRFSNPYICSLGVGLFYLFCKTFVSKRLSLVAAFLLAVSSYVMAFGKIGYNNLQALFALTLVLAIAAWVLRSQHLLAFACLGSALAFCFYTFPAALYVIPLPFLLLALYFPPINRRAAKQWMIMIAVFLALIFPLMLQPIYWETKVAGTFFNQPRLLQSFPVILEHFGSNILYAFFSYLYISSESHFVASSYLDPLTSALFLIGFYLLIFQNRRQRFAIFILLSYIFFIFVIGASHDRDAPPNTRMFMLLPLYTLIAAWGLIWIEEKARRVFAFRAWQSIAVVMIFFIVFTGVNLYQAYPLSHVRFASNQQIESLFIRISQRVYEAEPDTPKSYAVVVDETWGVDGLLFLQNAYSHLAWARIEQVRITEPVFSETSLPLLKDRNTIVIFFPWMDPTWVPILDTYMRELGKKPCVITTSAGAHRFMLYHDPSLPQACYP